MTNFLSFITQYFQLSVLMLIVIFLGYLLILAYSLCIHLARGEAWGFSVNECLIAGIPTIVSEWTGSKDLVCKISPELIVPLSPEKAILSYLALDENTKVKLSNKCREISSLQDSIPSKVDKINSI